MLAAFAALCMLHLLSVGAALAAPPKVDVEATQMDGFGRIVLTFNDMELLPAYSVSSSNGVLVIEFQDAVAGDVRDVPIHLSTYIPVARTDPDGHGMRFALMQGIKVHSMEAGAQLFIDLLPANWSGLPPSLPPEIIAQLAQRAEAALRAFRDASRHKTAGEEPELSIEVGRSPTFSRFVFRWNLPFDTVFVREKEAVSLTFNRYADVDLSALQATLPPFVDDIMALKTDDDRLKILIAVPPVADVRGFREDDTYVVDVSGPPDSAKADGPLQPLHDALKSDTPTNVTQMIVAPAQTGIEANAEPATMPPPAAPEVMTMPPKSAAAAPDAPVSEAAAAPAPEPAPAPASMEASSPANLFDPALAPAIAPPTPAIDYPGTEQPDAGFQDSTVKVNVQRVGTLNRLTFAYQKPVNAALFRRDGAIWLVFDDPMPIELGPLQAGLAGIAKRIETINPQGARALRIEMVDPLLATLSSEGNYWVVTIGDLITQPTQPLSIMRSVRNNGDSALDIPYPGAGRLIQILDPDIGDRLEVVTGGGAARGLIKDQTFAEFLALNSAYGLAFVPHVDDLDVVVHPNSSVSIERKGGLNISLSFPNLQAGAMGELQSANVEIPVGSNMLLSDYAVDDEHFWKARQKYELALSSAEGDNARLTAWNTLAKFYIANELGSEAQAAVKMIESIRPDDKDQPDHQLMVAAVDVLMHHPDDAEKLLRTEELQASPEAAFWRILALGELRRYPEVRANEPRGSTVIGNFPVDLQNRFLLSVARAAVETNDFGQAISAIRQIDRSTASADARDRIDLVNARIADANARSGDAVKLLNRVVLRGTSKTATEAALRLVQIQRREGLVTLKQAIERLEGLANAWRGDEIELDTLALLAQYSVEDGNYRRGFEALRTANLVDPDSDTTRQMNAAMSAAFASLYLDGEADKMEPLKALALYYDFKELTPIGRRGDEMVRKLANRLVDVDLLKQAAELLNHQVENRLKGVARAQVAADLAMVQLLDHRADRAMLTLSRTRQARLPATVERQRRIVEAKALAMSGKTDLALEMLSSLSGIDADRLTAETLWQTERHQEAGEAYERVLGARWSDTVPLTDIEQVEVLKAAISYALSQDKIGLGRLRDKYGTKMAGSPKAGIFDLVTGPIDTSGHEFGVIASNIAGIDTMKTFLADYRSQYVDSGSDNAVPVISPESRNAPGNDTPSAANTNGADPAVTDGAAGPSAAADVPGASAGQKAG
ncbi:putative lipoprotein [Hartmannibacter diazotrophicus]|uniref:Putative lipoprotein n=1 Tax=Hartmannibacter diazotrophicus TaxID=1482074 RepID=A0A2C9D7Q3_9HYPH|nr:hypothetical protein [Hartmannibacter diazotrophicus]SON56210.1 putative lipoprotein [Hartmannibacter diazotrophicus]